MKYLFFSQIISGWELAPHIEESRLQSKVIVQMVSPFSGSGRDGARASFETNEVGGRFPLWRRTPHAAEITLDSNVSFCSDMRVRLVNRESSFFGGTGHS